MKAVCWYGTEDVEVATVADPVVLNPHDAVLRIALTTICGSDLHLYDGFVPSMHRGDILGHEIIGEIVDTGPEVKKHKAGDRVVVASPIACGQCWYCRRQEYSLCDNTNPNAAAVEKLYN